jgi:hypothetical protein
LQQSAQVYFNVARVSPERLLRRSFAQPDRNQIDNQLFTKIAGKSLKSAADGGLMNVESSCNLEKSLAVEIISGEQKPVFPIKAPERACHGDGKLVQVGGYW